MPAETNLIWIDLEMTGLDPEKEVIIEIATIITDAQLNILAEGPALAIKQPDEVMDNMDEWCTTQHGMSGLTARVKSSIITTRMAEVVTLEFLRQHVPQGLSPMCGNTVSQDRRFLVRYMPELEAYFHYRHIDVSTLKELARRWKPELLKGYSKQSTHLALEDIRDSIEELKYYRKHFISA